MTPPKTIAPPELQKETEQDFEPLYHVVLLNDDFHTDVYVVEMLQKLFLHSASQAFQHMVEVHTTGRTIVITCGLAEAEFGRDQIHAYGPDPRVEACEGSMRALVEPAGRGPRAQDN